MCPNQTLRTQRLLAHCRAIKVPVTGKKGTLRKDVLMDRIVEAEEQAVRASWGLKRPRRRKR